MRQLVDQVRMHMRSLESLEQPVDNWDTMLIYLVLNKLDNATREDWETELTRNEEDTPTTDEFLKFLERRCVILEMTNSSLAKSESATTTKKEKKVTLTVTSQKEASTGCPHCKGNHALFKCDTFMKLSVQDKIQEVRRLGLCMNCLRAGHIWKDCRSSTCKKCKRQHNTLLHLEFREAQNQSKNEDQSTLNGTKKKQGQTSDNQSQLVAYCGPVKSKIILSSAEVYIPDSRGELHRCRALLDPGSQSHLMTENLAEKLKVKRKQINLPISGVNQKKTIIRHSTRIKVKSTVSRFTMDLECLITPSITDDIPQVSLDLNTLKVPEGIELADPDFNCSRPIDLLLGAATFWKILRSGESVTVKGQPTFQNTDLGWIVGGELITQNTAPSSVCLLINTPTLEQQLEKFWTIEELPMRDKTGQEQDYCEKQFLETHIRTEDGKFKVRLPQNPDIVLGDSFSGAVRRLQSLERRFVKDPKLKEEYVQFLRDYEAKQHMSLLQEKDTANKNAYYIPHQAVVRESSLTTKMRVVFDASAKTTSGYSLNEKLLPGPNLQNELMEILLRFRCCEYVFTADIKQMFRQILVDERDRHLQRIVWRESLESPIQIYTLNTVTYGTSCAPFLAMRCLRQLAHENKDKLPEVSMVLEKDFYMDDLLTGTNTKKEAIELRDRLFELCESGGFTLRKWRSNDKQVLENLSLGKNEDLLILDRESVKMLGL